MDIDKEKCPTDILVDLKDDDLPSYSKENRISDSFKSKVCLKEKENSLLPKDDHPSILDTSPVRIIDEFDFRLNSTLDTIMLQGSKLNEAVEGLIDCPTAILVDVPGSSSFTLKSKVEFNSSEYNYKQHEKYNNAAKELKDEFYESSPGDSRKDIINSSPEVDKRDNQLLLPRKRWKTPSPQSMSRISKEASKIINNLNSSSIFDEDSLLTEEKLPIFLNFDLEDDTDQDENVGENEMQRLSVNMVSQNSVMSSGIKENEIVNGVSSLMLNEKIPKINFIQSHSKTMNTNMSSKENVTSDCNLNSLSSASNSDSYDSSKFSVTNESVDDVFFEKQIFSEDEENMQRIEVCKNSKLNNETPSKNSLKIKSKVQVRGTLRNLSNIKSESTNSGKLSPSTKVMPLRRRSLAAKTKEIQSSVGKLQIKKTITGVGSDNMSKTSHGPNSFLQPSTKEFGKQSFKTNPTGLSSDSKCMSSSSDIRQQNTFLKMTTPSKRLSVSTPLKSASAVKTSRTPALHKNLPTRYTPQPGLPSRLSFSQSWQQSRNISNFKREEQNFTPKPCSESLKVSLGMQSAFNNQRRLSFSQSMSAASMSLGKNALSTTNKSRFYSKLNLPSPLPAEQDKKLARALFAGVIKK